MFRSEFVSVLPNGGLKCSLRGFCDMTVQAEETIPGYHAAVVRDFVAGGSFNAYARLINNITLRCDSLEFPEFWWEADLSRVRIPSGFVELGE